VGTPKPSARGGAEDEDSDDEPEELLRGGTPVIKPPTPKPPPVSKGRGNGKGGDRLVIKPIWLKKNVSMLASNRVWAVDKLAAKFNVKPVHAKCWAFLLNRCTNADRKLAMCPSPSEAAHKSATTAAHTLEGFVLESEIDEFSRAATEEERKKALEAAQKAQDAATKRGAGRGGSHFRQRTGA
jgi:hypothetical protein